MKKTILALSTFAVVIGIPAAQLNADDSLNQLLPNFVLGVGNSANPDQFLKSEVINLALDTTNQKIDEHTDELVSSTGFDRFDLRLTTLDSKLTTEMLAIYGISQTPSSYLFNQTSIVNYDSRSTLNTGIGYRFVSNHDLIIGVNAFYDYELGSKHQRYGFGGEVLGSMVELRANSYHANSKTITYKGETKKALDGSDVKLSLLMPIPWFESSKLYYQHSSWKDGASVSTKTKSAGLEIAFAENVKLDVGSVKTDNASAKTSATLTFTMPIGRLDQSPPLGSVESRLKQPVERENRIKKATQTSSGSSTTFTVKAGGF